MKIWHSLDICTTYMDVPGGIVLNREACVASGHPEGGDSIASALCYVPMTGKEKQEFLEKYEQER